MENRPWLSKYPTGIAANINPDLYPSIVDFFNEIFEKHTNQNAFTCMGKTFTYKQIDKYSMQFGAYLHSRGLEPGDRIALMMPNILQYPIALIGAMRAGLIVVNTNPLYTPREMKHQFIDSGVKAILIAENFAANLEKVIGETSIKTIITTSIGEMLGMIKGRMVNLVVRKFKGMVPAYKLPNTVTFKEALDQGKSFQIKSFECNAEDVLLHQYTGGTTGVSKGAMLTHRNIIANMLQIKATLEPYLDDDNRTILTALPLYHIFAFTVNMLACMSVGSHNILVTNARDLDSVVKEFKNHPINLFTGVNTLFNALLNNEGFKEVDFSPLKITVGGGMAVQKVVAESWKALTNCELCEGYGMTESSPVVTFNPIDGTGKIGTIGIPVPSTSVRIVDDNGHVVGANVIGEIQVQGPQVMKGYYNNIEETENTIKDGWLCTGDIGEMDSDGFFKIVDRKKDMILVSGFNVFPNEIENVIASHPKVLEVAAIGVPSEKSGEMVKVCIVKKDKSLKEEEIIEYCKDQLTGYKVPKVVEFRDELPKTNVGKILRRALK